MNCSCNTTNSLLNSKSLWIASEECGSGVCLYQRVNSACDCIMAGSSAGEDD